MHAARPTRLRPSAQAHLFEQRLHLHRHATHIVPSDTGDRIEIDAQLIGMIEITRTHRMRMQLHAAQIDDPRQPCRIVDDNLLRRSSRGKRQRHRAHPLRPVARRTLLVERLCLSTIYESLQHDGPIANPLQRPRRNR